MNPSRVVAGIASLAIGFGVTLVGVQVANDDDVAGEEQVTATSAEEQPPDAAGRAEAEQTSAPTAPSDTAGASAPSTTAAPQPGGAIVTPLDQAGGQDVNSLAECWWTYRSPDDTIWFVDTVYGDTFLVQDQESEREKEYTRDRNESGQISRWSSEAMKRTQVSPGDWTSCTGIVAPAMAEDVYRQFPCQAVRSRFDDLAAGNLQVPAAEESSVAETEREHFVHVLATALEDVNPASEKYQQFIDEVGSSFTGFGMPERLCESSELEAVEFFCFAGSISADDELLDYLDDPSIVQNAVEDCPRPSESTNGSGSSADANNGSTVENAGSNDGEDS